MLIAVFIASDARAQVAIDGIHAHYYLAARDGRRCSLEQEAKIRMQQEFTRFEELEVRAQGMWIAAALQPEDLPEGCIPVNTEGFFEQFPWAAQVTEPKSVTCQSCHCPQTWFYCVLSDGPPEFLKRFGYAPLALEEY